MRHHRLIVGLVVLSVVALPIATAAAAPTEDGVLADFVDGEDDGVDWSDRTERLGDQAARLFGASTYGFAHADLVFDDPAADRRRAKRYRHQFQQAFNQRNTSFVGYVNQRFDGNVSRFDVIGINITVDGETVHAYLVANTSDGNYTSARIVNATTRPVDHWVGVQDYAAARLDEEIVRLHDQFVATDDPVDRVYVTRIINVYGSNIDAPAGVTL